MISIKNVIYYPNKPLNNFELEEASKKLKIKCFRGVFLLDTLPKRIRRYYNSTIFKIRSNKIQYKR